MVVVHSLKLSSVGPSKVTGANVVHELSPMDVAMKLHYLTGLYYFSSQAAQGVTISSIKEAMFEWLNTYYIVCGRLKRWAETGRPYIKCNDCGVRIIEAVCDNTIQEWLSSSSSENHRNLLIYHQVIGPDISFSPPCLIQITQFKCGGMSLGLSWAHVLGDAIAAIDFINMWAEFLAGRRSLRPKPWKPIGRSGKSPAQCEEEEEEDPVCLKRVEAVGDHWRFDDEWKSRNMMKTFSFHVSHPQWIKFFKSDQIPPIFESICAVLWKLIGEVRSVEGGGNVITICKNHSSSSTKGGGLSHNNNRSRRQKVSFVKKGEVGSDPTELLGLLTAQLVEENEVIEEAVERSNMLGDFIVYGANLTFVDLMEAELYGVEMNGVKPLFAEYSIQGVGKEGVVIVAPGGPPSDNNNDTGVVVTMVMPEEQIPDIKHKLNINHLLSISS